MHCTYNNCFYTRISKCLSIQYKPSYYGSRLHIIGLITNKNNKYTQLNATADNNGEVLNHSYYGDYTDNHIRLVSILHKKHSIIAKIHSHALQRQQQYINKFPILTSDNNQSYYLPSDIMKTKFDYYSIDYKGIGNSIDDSIKEGKWPNRNIIPIDYKTRDRNQLLLLNIPRNQHNHMFQSKIIHRDRYMSKQLKKLLNEKETEINNLHQYIKNRNNNIINSPNEISDTVIRILNKYFGLLEENNYIDLLTICLENKLFVESLFVLDKAKDRAVNPEKKANIKLANNLVIKYIIQLQEYVNDNSVFLNHNLFSGDEIKSYFFNFFSGLHKNHRYYNNHFMYITFINIIAKLTYHTNYLANQSNVFNINNYTDYVIKLYNSGIKSEQLTIDDYNNILSILIHSCPSYHYTSVIHHFVDEMKQNNNLKFNARTYELLFLYYGLINKYETIVDTLIKNDKELIYSIKDKYSIHFVIKSYINYTIEPLKYMDILTELINYPYNNNLLYETYLLALQSIYTHYTTQITVIHNKTPNAIEYQLLKSDLINKINNYFNSILTVIQNTQLNSNTNNGDDDLFHTSNISNIIDTMVDTMFQLNSPLNSYNYLNRKIRWGLQSDSVNNNNFMQYAKLIKSFDNYIYQLKSSNGEYNELLSLCDSLHETIVLSGLIPYTPSTNTLTLTYNNNEEDKLRCALILYLYIRGVYRSNAHNHVYYKPFNGHQVNIQINHSTQTNNPLIVQQLLNDILKTYFNISSICDTQNNRENYTVTIASQTVDNWMQQLIHPVTSYQSSHHF